MSEVAFLIRREVERDAGGLRLARVATVAVSDEIPEPDRACAAFRTFMRGTPPPPEGDYEVIAVATSRRFAVESYDDHRSTELPVP